MPYFDKNRPPFYMDVTLLEEHGHSSAMIGLSLSKNQSPEHMRDVALKLSQQDGGHNKFLESIMLWVLVKAPRYWWQEADTYRIASKQSESTMHTLIKTIKSSGLKSEMFEGSLITQEQLYNVEKILLCEDLNETEALVLIKGYLPEGFLQTRQWCFSYKTLRNIAQQRMQHRLPHWCYFLHKLYNEIEHPEYLPIMPSTYFYLENMSI